MEVQEFKCKKCNIEMEDSIAIENTYTGAPDFIGDKYICTVAIGGSGKVIPCKKCPKCGYSIYKRVKGTNDTNRENT